MESDQEGGSGGSTPVQDEHIYNSDREEPMSVDQPGSPSGSHRRGSLSDGSDEDEVKKAMSGSEDSDNEGEKNEKSDDDDRPVGSPMSGPLSPNQNSQDVSQSSVNDAESLGGQNSPDQDFQSREIGQGSGSGPNSPNQESRSGPNSPDQESRSGSPTTQQNRSRSASLEQRSRSGSRSPGNRSRSGSPSQRSRSGSPDQRSRSGSPGQRSRSGSPGQRAAPGSPDQRSRSGSPGQRSRSGSPGKRSRSGSPGQRSRSGSPGQRSRSGSPGQRSRSGSPGQRSRSGSPGHRSRSVSPGQRSRSGSPGQRSRSGSPGPRSRSGSPQRSRSRSPAKSSRSGSQSPQRSRSRSGSPGQGSGADHRSRSGSRSPGQRSMSPENQSAEGEKKKKLKRKSPLSDGESDVEVEQPADDNAAAKGDDSDEEDESDKESAVGGLIADIFGSSDEDEEFEGFGVADVEAPVKKKEKKKTAVVSDDDDEEGVPESGDIQEEAEGNEDGSIPAERLQGDGDAPQAGSDDDDMLKEDRADLVSDFELMMQRKKEESQKFRRKRRDVDIINDNDDLIADMINKMKTAAEEDRIANESKKAATKKIKYLPAVRSQLKKADLHVAFLDCGILSAMTEWLAPLPDRSLPHIQIREAMLKFLSEFPPIGTDTLKVSGIGKAVMYIYKHPKETRENKERAGKLINEWSRPIFNLTSNFKSLSREERQQRDYDQLPKRRRLSSDGSQTPRRDIDKALAGEDKALRPGDPGWIYRARVPNPSHKDYVVRPRWNVEEVPLKGSSKKQVSRYEKHMRAFQEKKKGSKNQRAVTISIEGRNMSL